MDTIRISNSRPFLSICNSYSRHFMSNKTRNCGFYLGGAASLINIPNVFQKSVFSCTGIPNFEPISIDPVLHRVCFDVSFAWFKFRAPALLKFQFLKYVRYKRNRLIIFRCFLYFYQSNFSENPKLFLLLLMTSLAVLQPHHYRFFWQVPPKYDRK